MALTRRILSIMILGIFLATLICFYKNDNVEGSINGSYNGKPIEDSLKIENVTNSYSDSLSSAYEAIDPHSFQTRFPSEIKYPEIEHDDNPFETNPLKTVYDTQWIAGYIIGFDVALLLGAALSAGAQALASIVITAVKALPSMVLIMNKIGTVISYAKKFACCGVGKALLIGAAIATAAGVTAGTTVTLEELGAFIGELVAYGLGTVLTLAQFGDFINIDCGILDNILPLMAKLISHGVEVVQTCFDRAVKWIITIGPELVKKMLEKFGIIMPKVNTKSIFTLFILMVEDGSKVVDNPLDPKYTRKIYCNDLIIKTGNSNGGWVHAMNNHLGPQATHNPWRWADGRYLTEIEVENLIDEAMSHGTLKINNKNKEYIDLLYEKEGLYNAKGFLISKKKASNEFQTTWQLSPQAWDAKIRG